MSYRFLTTLAVITVFIGLSNSSAVTNRDICVTLAQNKFNFVCLVECKNKFDPLYLNARTEKEMRSIDVALKACQDPCTQTLLSELQECTKLK